MKSEGAALILAGGKSSRLGGDKTLLPWQGTTILAALATRLQKTLAHVLIVTTPDHQLASPAGRIVHDLIPGKNSLGGLHAGLTQSPAQKNFICACDMPLLLPELAQGLTARSSRFEVIIPHVHDRLQPLCAVYDKACRSSRACGRAIAHDGLAFPVARVRSKRSRVAAGRCGAASVSQCEYRGRLSPSGGGVLDKRTAAPVTGAAGE